jgi:hypothetical protein
MIMDGFAGFLSLMDSIPWMNINGLFWSIH